MTKLAPEWVLTSDPVIRSPARYRWTTAPALILISVQFLRMTATERHDRSAMLVVGFCCRIYSSSRYDRSSLSIIGKRSHRRSDNGGEGFSDI